MDGARSIRVGHRKSLHSSSERKHFKDVDSNSGAESSDKMIVQKQCRIILSEMNLTASWNQQQSLANTAIQF